MALIGTLREKMTRWVVGFVGIAIAAFVLNDLFGGQTSIFNKNKNIVGKINGVDISLIEYQQAIQQQKGYYMANLGRQPYANEMPSIRQQAWEYLILRHAIEPQYQKVGVTVSSDEEWDMIQGKNINESIKTLFTDSTGQFNHKGLIDYLKNLSVQPQNSEPQIRWKMFKSSLTSSRISTKFNNLMLKSIYIPQAEGEKAYHLENDVADIKYIYVPFQSVADSLVSVSETDIEDYYKENKEKYKVKQTRNIKYVLFSLKPSGNDSTALLGELKELRKSFETTKEDSLFVAIHTDSKTILATYSPSTLPSALSNQGNSLHIGDVIGPFRDGDTYKMVKVIATAIDPQFHARARHILIRIKDDDAQAAKIKARKILQDIKNGADFAETAKKFGTDGTASRGGDLGWFSTGQMVKPFEEAVFNAKAPGLIPRLVKTNFGYHIIDVTHTKSNTSYTMVTIERKIVPSDETRNKVYRVADLFAGKAMQSSDFEQEARADSLTVYSAEQITTTANKINMIDNTRNVVIWLFRDAKKGTVSKVFDVSNNYMVAIMTGEIKEGYNAPENVKEEITSIVRKNKKGAMVINKLKKLTGTLEKIAQAYGSQAIIDSASNVKFSNNSLPKVGLDPTAVGRAFALNAGEHSSPFSGERGVLIVEMISKTTAPSLGDYTSFTNEIKKKQTKTTQENIIPAIKDMLSIEDNRHLFY